MISLFARFIGLLALLASGTAYAQPVDVSKLMSTAQVQTFVKGSVLVGKPSKVGDTSKYMFADKGFDTFPLVTVEVQSEKNAAAALSKKLETISKMMNLQAKKIDGIGDEAFHEPQFNTVYFRKGNKMATVTGTKGSGAISVDLFGMCKDLASRL